MVNFMVSRGVAIAAFALLGVSGCAMPSTSSESLAEGDSAPTAIAQPWTPLPAEQCQDLQSAMAETIATAVSLETTDFQDYISGTAGTGCQLTATGTGAEFESFGAVAEDLKALLSEAGWTEDPQYLADGPTGTATGFRNANQLGLLSVEWQPSAQVSCPADQPISACEVPPEQQIYTVTLNLAQS